jgi:hypothetical protein
VSRFGHFVHRLEHKVVRQVTASAKQFGNFTQRAVRGVELYAHRAGNQIGGAHNQLFRNVEHGAQRGFIYSVKVSPYVTAVAAFIVNLIPVIGWIISAAIVALGTAAARFTGYYAARYEGATTQEARNYGRTMAHRNLISGMIGSALGGILSAFGVTLGGAAEGAETGSEAALAGEAGHFNSAEVASSELGAQSGAEWGAGWGAAEAGVETASPVGAIAGANAGVSLGGGSLFLFPSESLSIFTKAWNFATQNPKELLTGAYSLYTQVLKKITPAPAPGFSFSFPGMGGRGGDPGGPGPGGSGGGTGWDELEAAAESFIHKYGEWVAAALAVVLVAVLLLR